MERLTEAALDELERRFPQGLPSQEIVSLLEQHGVRCSEATLRKYVQLGLLPRSVRVGREDGARGSQGLYPAGVVRQIVEIKKRLGENRSIDELRQENFLLRTEIQEIDQRLRRLFEGVEGTLKTRGDAAGGALARRELREARAATGELLTRLRALESRLSLGARDQQDLSRAVG